MNESSSEQDLESQSNFDLEPLENVSSGSKYGPPLEPPPRDQRVSPFL